MPLGQQVGYAVRFSDQTSEGTLIKVMTDGLLLNEITSDRWLSNYDALIIDEAHERSLNIDFLLGYVKVLLGKRADLKVIITSATIDVGAFAQALRRCARRAGERPRLSRRSGVSTGRRCGDVDQPQQILDAIREIERRPIQRASDVLVFLIGRARDPRNIEAAATRTARSLRHPAAVRAPAHGRTAAHLRRPADGVASCLQRTSRKRR